MVDELAVMMIAVVVAVVIMLIASKPLTSFVNKHPTVVVLCLSFLLMIGFSLIAEGLSFKIPKGYLYAAIGFSILIEIFNQIARRNFIKNESSIPRRIRTAEAIQRLMGGTKEHVDDNDGTLTPDLISEDSFAVEEREMVKGVLTLASLPLRSIMTPRNEMSWVNCRLSKAEMRAQVLSSPHSLLPICDGELDNIVGVMRAKELLVALDADKNIFEVAALSPAIIISETLDPINLLNILRRAQGSLVIVTNEFGILQGLVTPLDLLETIAGEFPDADETLEITVESNNSWLVKGSTAIHSLQRHLDVDLESLVKDKTIATVAGLIISVNGHIPQKDESFELPPLHLTVVEANDFRIDLIRVQVKSD